MRLSLLCVGRCKAGAEKELSLRYVERAAAAGRALGFSRVELREFDESRARDAASRKTAEARAIVASLTPGGVLAAFDEAGAGWSSRDFAAFLGATRDRGAPVLALAIGGPDGHGDEVRAAATSLISFGAMTLPHQLARILAAEQIYRALTILAGHPYHRD